MLEKVVSNPTATSKKKTTVIALLASLLLIFVAFLGVLQQDQLRSVTRSA